MINSSSTIGKYYYSLLKNLVYEKDNSDFSIESFTNKEQDNLISNSNFSKDEIIILSHQLGILKYSYSLWSNN